MYKCKECSHRISFDADACPSCGCKDPLYKKEIEKSRSGITWSILLCFLFVVLSFEVSLWWLIGVVLIIFGIINYTDDLNSYKRSQNELYIE
jgi:hypothetical protein